MIALFPVLSHSQLFSSFGVTALCEFWPAHESQLLYLLYCNMSSLKVNLTEATASLLCI
jgi:hypothetical protein